MPDKTAKILDLLETVLSRLLDELPGPKKPAPSPNQFTDIQSRPSAMVVWERGSFFAPENIASVKLSLLKGIDSQKKELEENTRNFAKGLPGNDAMLWGARGTGKSSLVKAIVKKLQKEFPSLCLVEIAREDIAHLPILLRLLEKDRSSRFVVFCDDLSFSPEENAYKTLKSILDGHISARPLLFYATSNHRHLLPTPDMPLHDFIKRDQKDELLSLSDRFGLWLGFHAIDEALYLDIIEGYLAEYNLPASGVWKKEALEWARDRGALSGRIAWHFIKYFAAKHEIKLLL